jgi:hypothetical protein
MDPIGGDRRISSDTTEGGAMRRLALVPIVFCVAAGLTATVAAGDGGPSPGVLTGGAGVLAPGGAVRYVALVTDNGTNAQTAVAAVRVRDGKVLRYRSFDGAFGVPLVAYDGSADAVSGDGRTLVLSHFAAPPSPQAVSRFPIVSTRTLKPQQVITLKGSFSYDAISPDGATIYLIEYLSQPPSVRYRVRALDVATGRLAPGAIVDKREPGPMQGYPLARASAQGGGWAFTLYRKDAGHAFVHALDTRNRTAVCIDLPWRIGAAATVRMGMSGARLVLRQPAVGTLATIDTRTMRVTALRPPT